MNHRTNDSPNTYRVNSQRDRERDIVERRGENETAEEGGDERVEREVAGREEKHAVEERRLGGDGGGFPELLQGGEELRVGKRERRERSEAEEMCESLGGSEGGGG